MQSNQTVVFQHVVYTNFSGLISGHAKTISGLVMVVVVMVRNVLLSY